MINRIIIRIKVLQVVYAYYQKNSRDLVSAENELLFSLEKTYDLYHYLLLLIVLLTNAEQKRLDKNKNKLLATEDELNPNRRLADNRFAEQLRVNGKLTAFSMRRGTLWNDDNSLFVRNLLKKIIQSDYYKEYLAVIVLYGLLLQIRIIARQKRIAELRQDFTHAMVHDMKSPLTTILMGIRSLKSGKIDDKPQMKEQHYAIIIQEGERMLGLANKILEIAQFEGQQVILSKQPVNLPDLIGSLTEKYQLNVTKNVHFHIESGVEYIYADPHYIAEAFGNIIDNAIKYSKENEDAEIYITSSYENNTVRLAFKDNGTGISPKDQQKIFQKFERADSVTRSKKKISGFGLGLTFVSQVIKAHDGEIKINSRLGSFSEFIINLPYDENSKIIID
ncbi:hypothetical protein FACS1894177_05890 [Bacteroidia bacterium]|nr:hypothetical protein FACS1894177_05890 [Bacteroidia bacterium]